MGPIGASCFHTITTETRTIPKPVWDIERFGMICTQSTNFAEWKATIEKLCQVTRKCDFVTKQAIAEFFARVDKLRH